MTLITSSLEPFKKVSRRASSPEFFDKLLRKKCIYGKILKKHFCWILSNISWVFDSNSCFPGKWFPSFTYSVREVQFGKTCICREIKSTIVVKVFSISCVCFPYITGSAFFQLTQKETLDKYDNSIFKSVILCFWFI